MGSCAPPTRSATTPCWPTTSARRTRSRPRPAPTSRSVTSTTWPSPSGPARRSGPSPCPEPPVLFLDPLLRPSGMLSSLPLWLLLLPFSTPLLPFPFPEPFPVLFPAPLLRLSGTSSSLPLLQLPEGRRVPPRARNHPWTDSWLPCRSSVVPAAARSYCSCRKEEEVSPRARYHRSCSGSAAEAQWYAQQLAALAPAAPLQYTAASLPVAGTIPGLAPGSPAEAQWYQQQLAAIAAAGRKKRSLPVPGTIPGLISGSPAEAQWYQQQLAHIALQG